MVTLLFSKFSKINWLVWEIDILCNAQLNFPIIFPVCMNGLKKYLFVILNGALIIRPLC